VVLVTVLVEVLLSPPHAARDDATAAMPIVRMAATKVVGGRLARGLIALSLITMAAYGGVNCQRSLR
jgi:hypothetical protein